MPAANNNKYVACTHNIKIWSDWLCKTIALQLSLKVLVQLDYGMESSLMSRSDSWDSSDARRGEPEPLEPGLLMVSPLSSMALWRTLPLRSRLYFTRCLSESQQDWYLENDLQSSYCSIVTTDLQRPANHNILVTVPAPIWIGINHY